MKTFQELMAAETVTAQEVAAFLEERAKTDPVIPAYEKVAALIARVAESEFDRPSLERVANALTIWMIGVWSHEMAVSYLQLLRSLLQEYSDLWVEAHLTQ